MANIAHHLFRNARDRPDKAALIFGGREITFAELRDRAAQVSAGLREQGFRTGDKAALMLSTAPEFVVFEFAVFTLGGIVLPLNVHYMPSEIEYALSTCDVDWLVIQDVYAQRLEAGFPQRLPRLRRVFVVGGAAMASAHGMLHPAMRLFAGSSRVNHPVECGCDDVALMLHTSATTGKAKGVMLTIGNLQANYDRTPEWLGLGQADRILCALPLYNTFGLNQCINAIMVTGATLVLLPKFDTCDVLTAMQKYRCTFFPAVPTMLQKLLNAPEAARFDLTSVKRLLVGGAPVPGPLLKQVHHAMGADAVVMTGYGLTEASALVSLEQTAFDAEGNVCRPKSVGRALPGIQMKIQPDGGGEAAPHTVGQIVIKGPNVMKGYYKLAAESAAVIIDGWLQTGDLGYADAGGHFYVVDRQKDLIIRGGQNVYPADIEECLYTHPAVAEAAVVGRPDEVFGEVPEAYVAFKPGVTVGVDELMERCKARLAYFKVPKLIHVLEELPKGPTGKLLRRCLRSAPPHA